MVSTALGGEVRNESGTSRQPERCYKCKTWDGQPHPGSHQPRFTVGCILPWPSLAVEPEQLVSSSISQQDRIELYPVSLRVKRPGAHSKAPEPFDRSGTTIDSFSKKSRSNLRFTAVNAFPALISQFGLTYHDQWPTDGRTSKRHLNAWLTAVRRLIPDIGYLWLMEFQTRGAPHFHVFFTIPPDEQLRLRLAEYWCRITSPGDEVALRFHQDQRNWIDWNMNTAGYLCKYLDKEAQKFVPDGYVNFGRFWGNSRNIKPTPLSIPVEDLEIFGEVDQHTGEVTSGAPRIIRWLGRLAEKQTNGYSRFRKRAQVGSYTMLQGAAAYRQIEKYLNK